MKKQNAPGRQTPGEVLPKALLTLTAVLICCGYLFSTYLPELPALRSVVICLGFVSDALADNTVRFIQHNIWQNI